MEAFFRQLSYIYNSLLSSILFGINGQGGGGGVGVVSKETVVLRGRGGIETDVW